MRPTREAIEQVALEAIRNGRYQIDADGDIQSVLRNGTVRSVGHTGNPRQNMAINFKIDGHVCRVQGGRLAWAIHYREWPPEHMSVVMVNGNKRDFRRDNLALVPRGKERTFKKLLADLESE